MKWFCVSLILSILSCDCIGQTKTIEAPDRVRKDSAYFAQMRGNDLECNGLPNLLKSKDSLHFRFSNEMQSVDIWTNDYKTFYGTLLNHTNAIKYKKNGTLKEGRPHKKKQNIDTTIAKEIYTLFVALRIFSIPDQCHIKGWVNYIAFQPYIIEYTTPTNYSIKSYSSVYYYKHKLKEAASIDSLARELGEKLEMQKSFDKFITGLPYGCYEYGGCVDVCNLRPTRFNWLRKHYLTSLPPFLHSHKRLIRKMPGYYMSRFPISGSETTQIQLNKDKTFKYKHIDYLDSDLASGKFEYLKDTVYFNYTFDSINIYRPLDTTKTYEAMDTSGEWIKVKPKMKVKYVVSLRPQKMLYRYGRLWELSSSGYVLSRKRVMDNHRKRYYLKRVKSDE